MPGISCCERLVAAVDGGGGLGEEWFEIDELLLSIVSRHTWLTDNTLAEWMSG